MNCREVVDPARGSRVSLPGSVGEEVRNIVSDNQLDLREDLKRIYGRRKEGQDRKRMECSAGWCGDV